MGHPRKIKKLLTYLLTYLLTDGDKFAFGTYVPNVISEPIVNDRVDIHL